MVCTFLWLMQLSTMPVAASGTSGQTGVVSAEQGPDYYESVSQKAAVAKKKGSILPYILIGLGFVAVSVAIYFLVIKKPNYTLTVTLGAGCTGTPAILGNHKKGTVVPYSYTALDGYIDVNVLLDGVAVPASGTITMDKNKALTVSAEALGIRGTWTMLFVATNVVKNFTYSMIFSGSLSSGSIAFFDWAGTYTVTGNNVAMNFSLYQPNDLVMTGSFTGTNAMAGTAVLTNLLIDGVHVTDANWTATRTAPTAYSDDSKPTTEETLRK